VKLVEDKKGLKVYEEIYRKFDEWKKRDLHCILYYDNWGLCCSEKD